MQSELQLVNILIKSLIFPSKTYIELFLNHAWVYVNGMGINNPLFQLMLGDVIQIVTSMRYYIIFKWLNNWTLKQKLRLKKRMWRLSNSYFLPDDKQKSYHFPKWIYYSKNVNDDISKFIEVDFFSLSIIILYEPFIYYDLNFYNIYELKINILNLYNWKYIT